MNRNEIQVFARDEDYGWFDVFRNGEWIDAFPSYQSACMAAKEFE